MLLGGAAFVEKIGPQLKAAEAVTEIAKRQRKLHRPALKKLLAETGSKEARDQAMASVYLEHGYTLAEIGRAVGLHYATVSRIIKAPEAR